MVAYQLPSAFVDRETESNRLSDRLDLALAGRGGLMLVAGETGMGKSALLARLASEAQARGVTVLVGAADVQPTASPYGLWIDLIRSWTPEKGLPAPPGWLDSDSFTPGVETRGTLFHEIHRFFVRITEMTPLLMILEDLHRADAASVEVLRYTNRRLHNLPLLLVCSIRTDELTDHSPLYHHLPELVREASVERIELGRLDGLAIQELITERYRLPEDEGKRLTSYIQERSEGNPLFITELLRVLEEERIIQASDGEWALGPLDRVPVPPLVRQTIDGRLRHLDEGVRWVISVAALLGREVPLDTLRQVTGTDERQLESAIHAAMEQGILIHSTDGSLIFRHALYREILEAGIILPRRRGLHKQIADTLLSGSAVAPDADRVAYHLWSARDHRAAEWLVRAGERASKIYAYEVAEQRLDRALDLTEDLADSLRIHALRLRAHAREMMGRVDQAIEDQHSLLSLARTRGEPGETWQALVELGDLWTARDYREVGAYYQQALEHAREIGDQRILAHSLNRIGNWYTNIDEPQSGLQYHRDALELFDQAGDDAGVAQSIDFQAMASYLYGDMNSSAENYRRAIRLFREQHDRRGMATSLPTLMMAGGSYDTETVAVASGSDEEWLRFGNEGLAVAREIGWQATEAYILSHFGLALGMRGAYQAALDFARQALDLATAIGHREWITAAHFALGVILVDCLNTSLAISHLRQARDSAVASHSIFWSRISSAALAWAYLTEGEANAAARTLDTAIDASSGFGSISLRQCWLRRAETELMRSNPAQALDIADHLIRTVPGEAGVGPVPHLAWLRGRALTATGNYHEAREELEAARSGADAAGYRPLVWRIDLALGRLSELTGDRHSMVEALDRGGEVATALARQLEDESLRVEFQHRAMLMLGPQSGATKRGQNPFDLSQREQEVLALVAEGMTDGEVGQQLVISPRTVGRHLQSIYTKLGVNSRTAAVRIALERHLI